MRVVVTGAAGLIGGRLVGRLASNHEVWALTRRPLTRPAHEAVHWVVGDVTSPSLLSALPDGADAVVHLAQSAYFREFPEHAQDVFDVNVASTARLLDWSYRAGVRHFVLASTGGVAGAGKPSFYLASKRSAELLTQTYEDRLSTLVLRFFFVYGREQRPSMLVPRLVHSIRTGDPIRLTGADGPRLNPAHVDDAVAALATAIEQRATGQVDVAGPDVLSLRQMCLVIASRVNSEVTFVDLAGEAEDVVGDITSMTERFGPPRCPFSEGVVEMVDGAETSRGPS